MRILILFLAILIAACSATPTQVPTPTPAPRIFDGKHAYDEYVLAQMKFGARPAGSAADRATSDYIVAQLKQSNWKTETQELTYRNVPIRNVIGKIAEGRGPLIIIGAHFDSRPRADQDKLHPDQPVPAANDGASGVAVMLELARTLDILKLKNEIWLAFLDAEDNGDLPGCQVQPPPCDTTLWPFSVGTTYLADHLSTRPVAVIILDMIGDADQNIYYERNSDADYMQQIWTVAASLGYTREFIPEYKWSMEDDHTPFLERGIRAVDMIDFDYPYWHTTEDTADKVSAASLERVGRTMKTWLENSPAVK